MEGVDKLCVHINIDREVKCALVECFIMAYMVKKQLNSPRVLSEINAFKGITPSSHLVILHSHFHSPHQFILFTAVGIVCLYLSNFTFFVFFLFCEWTIYQITVGEAFNQFLFIICVYH